MTTPLRLLITAVSALTLIAAPAFTQETAKPATKPGGAKTKVVKPESEEGAATGAAKARDHKEVLKPVAFEEARYRKRLAQLDRIEQIATEKQNSKMLAEVAELRMRNDAQHSKRNLKLRTQFGDEQVDAALAFLEKHGKGRPVMPPKNDRAREAMKGQAGGKAGEKIKDAQKDADKVREKVKDKPVEKP